MCVCVCVFTSSAPPNEAQVVEAGHLVLHHGGSVPQLGRVVLVVPGHDGDQSTIRDITEGHNLCGEKKKRLDRHRGAPKTPSSFVNIFLRGNKCLHTDYFPEKAAPFHCTNLKYVRVMIL